MLEIAYHVKGEDVTKGYALDPRDPIHLNRTKKTLEDTPTLLAIKAVGIPEGKAVRCYRRCPVPARESSSIA